MGVRGSGASRSSASVADPPAVMAIMRDELPNTQVVILSLSSPASRRRVDARQDRLAFLRHERNAPGIVFTQLTDEPLIVLMPAAIRTRDRSGSRGRKTPWRVQPVREGQELGGKLLGGLEICLMPGVDLAERRIWNPVTEIASAGDDLIVGASDNERRASDPAGSAWMSTRRSSSTCRARPSQFVPVRMPWASASRCAASGLAKNLSDRVVSAMSWMNPPDPPR